MKLTIDAEDTSDGEILPALTLRPPEERDLDALSRIFNDPETVAYTLVPSPWDAEHRDAYVGLCAKSWEEGSPRWVIADAADAAVGTAGLIRRGPGEVEVVYVTAPRVRRQTIALRACRRAAAFAFDDMGATRLSWGAKVGNHVSRLIALRLGFRMEGVARSGEEQRGEPVDEWVAAMLSGELRDLDDPPEGYARERTRAAVFCRPQPILDTELPELSLRPARETDLDAIYKACQDAEMQRWTTIPRPYEREHAEGFLRFAEDGWRRGEKAVFVMADADDRYCGSVDLRLNHGGDPGSAEVGFHTAPWARGKGYMTEATRRVCAYAFEELDVERVVWRAMVGNDGSRRVADKAGFVFEGTLHGELVRFGERSDGWMGSKLRGNE
ncbi:MAG: GNAT family N-acetyltransferase [Stackebrandtia sp.]